MPKVKGYIRASTDDQENTLETQREELERAGCVELYIDQLSGAVNISGSKKSLDSDWQRLRAGIEKGDRVVVVSQSRLGRKSYEVQYAVGKLIEDGAEVQVLEDNRIYDDLDDFSQNMNLSFRAVTDQNERVEIKRRTKKTLNYLKANEVKLGTPPKLSRSLVNYILLLREAKMTIREIAAEVKVYSKKHDKLMPISTTTVQKVIKGTYGLTLEDTEEHNRRARENMVKIARSKQALEGRRSGAKGADHE
ncbi:MULTISPECIES: recombinase family protein [unclassified Curtobacterium]|uniref:recombinase family protein n=1 Tax=unclassified Curtobacterium TaxID=257496 RepID=UPI00382A0A2C